MTDDIRRLLFRVRLCFCHLLRLLLLFLLVFFVFSLLYDDDVDDGDDDDVHYDLRL